MAEIVTKTYTCDRCGEDMGAEPQQGSRVVTLNAIVSYLRDGATGISWQHLCNPCGAEVVSFLNETPGHRL